MIINNSCELFGLNEYGDDKDMPVWRTGVLSKSCVSIQLRPLT